MNKEEIQKKLFNLFDEQVPDQFAQILSKSQKEERNYDMEKNKKNQGWWWKLSIAFTFLLMFSGFFYVYQGNHAVDSIIEIDVNPSIQLEVNKHEKVVKWSALNEDAEEILKDMDLKNVDIDVALNAIIGSMVTKGYLDDLSNSILISVDNDDPKKAEELRQELAQKINQILNTDKIEGSILSQTLSETSNKEKKSEIDALAQKYHISTGKAKLILEVVANNPLLTVEDLVDLSINEINILTQGKESSLSSIEKQGNASTKAYIGEEKAKEIAFNHAGVKNPQYVEIEFDTENGIILYEIEFYENNNEYEYEINALTGDIITNKKEEEKTNTPSNNSDSLISTEKAKEIALNHAGIKNPQNLKVELDREDQEYSVEFTYNGYEYEYEINAVTGKIIKSEKELDESASRNSNTNFISSDKAKEIALNHAGIKNPQNLKVELDRDDQEYSVEFLYNGYEYEYEINATTGKIIKSEKERDD